MAPGGLPGQEKLITLGSVASLSSLGTSVSPSPFGDHLNCLGQETALWVFTCFGNRKGVVAILHLLWQSGTWLESPDPKASRGSSWACPRSDGLTSQAQGQDTGIFCAQLMASSKSELQVSPSVPTSFVPHPQSLCSSQQPLWALPLADYLLALYLSRSTSSSPALSPAHRACKARLPSTSGFLRRYPHVPGATQRSGAPCKSH